MQFENVSIMGLAHVDAPLRVTSREIGQRLAPTLEKFGLGPKLIESLTGIYARRFWEEDTQPSAAATLAARKAIEKARLNPPELGLLINTSVSKDYIEPSVACLVHGNLGLGSECLNFDVGNACLAFLNGLEIAGAMIERGAVDHALIVDGESSRFAVEATIERLLDPQCTPEMFRENFATLTLGSGAGAMVLAKADLVPDAPRVKGAVTLSDTEHNGLCRGQVDGMITDAGGLLTAGLALAERTWAKAGQEMGWSPDDLDVFILHQVSAVHTAKLAQILGLNPEKIFKTYPEFGNIGPAAVPITFSKAQEAGWIQKGSRVALMGIGSGLNCTMMEVVW